MATKFEWTNLKLRSKQYCYKDKLQFDVTIKRGDVKDIDTTVFVDPETRRGFLVTPTMKVSLEPSYNDKRIMRAAGITMATLPKLRETVVAEAEKVWSRWQPAVDVWQVNDEKRFTGWKLGRYGQELTVTFEHVPYGLDGQTFSGEATFLVHRSDVSGEFSVTGKGYEVNLSNDAITAAERKNSYGVHDPSGRFAEAFRSWLGPVAVQWLNQHKPDVLTLMLDRANTELQWAEGEVVQYISLLQRSREGVKARQADIDKLKQELQQFSEVADNA